MEKTNNMNVYSLDEFINEEIGTAGTPEREMFDAKVAEKIMASKSKTSYHLTMPSELHESISKRASQLGQSVSTYISTIMAREISLTQISQ